MSQKQKKDNNSLFFWLRKKFCINKQSSIPFIKALNKKTEKITQFKQKGTNAQNIQNHLSHNSEIFPISYHNYNFNNHFIITLLYYSLVIWRAKESERKNFGLQSHLIFFHVSSVNRYKKSLHFLTPISLSLLLYLSCTHKL